MEALPWDTILAWLAVLSVVGFIGTLIAIPYVLVRLPSDYFDIRVPRTWMKDHHPVLRMIGLIAKNAIGAVFFLAGFAMLFLPGQGILTMLIGISLMDFPGKRRLEAKLVGQPTVLQAINKMREKFGKPPLTVKDDP
ncbi:MAG: PGPGW domain-containing protein [Nitrospirota bacterium]